MILTCPECHTKYNVSSQAIGEDGRQVRCMNCGYEWFEEPEHDSEILDEPEEQEEAFVEEREPFDPDDVEPIPDAVKPVPEGSELPAMRDIKQERPKKSFDKAKYMGYAAAAGVFGLIIGGMVIAHKPMTKMWPASIAFYERIGIETKIDGEDLIFDQLQAVAVKREKGSPILNVDAQILNLARESSKVPNVQASVIGSDGEMVDSWVITPDKKSLEREGEVAFHTAYPDLPEDAREVNLKFIQGSKADKPKGQKDHGDGEHGENHEAEEVDQKEATKGSYLH